MDANNVVMLRGKIAGEFRLRYSEKGTALGSSRLLVQDGRGRLYMGLSFYGDTAERLSEVIAEGDEISVVGSLSSYQYEKDGKKQYGYTVRVTGVDSPKLGSDASGPSGGGRTKQAAADDLDDSMFF